MTQCGLLQVDTGHSRTLRTKPDLRDLPMLVSKGVSWKDYRIPKVAKVGLPLLAALHSIISSVCAFATFQIMSFKSSHTNTSFCFVVVRRLKLQSINFATHWHSQHEGINFNLGMQQKTLGYKLQIIGHNTIFPCSMNLLHVGGWNFTIYVRSMNAHSALQKEYSHANLAANCDDYPACVGGGVAVRVFKECRWFFVVIVRTGQTNCPWQSQRGIPNHWSQQDKPRGKKTCHDLQVQLTQQVFSTLLTFRMTIS